MNGLCLFLLGAVLGYCFGKRRSNRPAFRYDAKSKVLTLNASLPPMTLDDRVEIHYQYTD